MLCSFSILSRYVDRSSSFIASSVECCTSFFSTRNPNNCDLSLIALTAAEYCFLLQASAYTLSSFSTSFDTDSLVKRLASTLNLSIYWIILSFFKLRADRKSTRLNSSHPSRSRMPSSAWKKKQKIQSTWEISIAKETINCL